MKLILKVAFVAASVVAFILAPKAHSAEPSPDPKKSSVGAWLAELEVAPYATVHWDKLAGQSTGGAGFGISHSIFKNVSIRLSAEADSWKPKDYLIDRAWGDVVVKAKLSKAVDAYGFGGFGYQLGCHDVLARAGLGLKSYLFKAGPVRFGPFAEGSLEASTGNYQGARLTGGLALGF